MLKKVLFLSLLLQGVAALGQTGITVKLPASGEFAVFTSRGLPTELPAKPTATKGGSIAVTPLAGDDTISVWDKTSGNVGSRSLAKLKAGWAPATGDLDHVALVRIHVEHNGSPVSSGEVTLEDGLKRSPQLLDSKALGDAAFFDVKPGRILATTKFRGAKDLVQVIQCPLVRSQQIPSFSVAIAEDVDTIIAQPTGVKPGPGYDTRSQAATAPPESQASPFGSAIVFLIAIAIAAALIYFALMYVKKSPGAVAEKLEQLGVQIPKPDDEGAMGGAPVPIVVAKPEPPQKILLDDAAPTPLSASSYSPSASMVLDKEPALLSSSGIPLPLAEGETIVGRDAGLGLSLTGETTISRKHATLARQGETVTLTDLGSTNGTFVNGVRLQSPTVLRPGDSVQFGSVQFKYQG